MLSYWLEAHIPLVYLDAESCPLPQDYGYTKATNTLSRQSRDCEMPSWYSLAIALSFCYIAPVSEPMRLGNQPSDTT